MLYLNTIVNSKNDEKAVSSEFLKTMHACFQRLFSVFNTHYLLTDSKGFFH